MAAAEATAAGASEGPSARRARTASPAPARKAQPKDDDAVPKDDAKVPARRTYPTFWQAMLPQLRDLQKMFYLAIFQVYVLHHHRFGLPRFLRAAAESPAVQQVAAWTEAHLPLNGHSALDVLIIVFLANFVHSFLYLVVNGLFLTCDVRGWLVRYKLPRTRPVQKLNWTLIYKTWREAARGQLLINPAGFFFLVILCTRFPSFYEADGVTARPPLSLLATWKHFVGAFYFNEIVFYWAHRWFHEVPLLYAKVHKQHHQYVGSIGFAAEYAHPVEQFVANLGPTIGYCTIFSSWVTPCMFCTWLGARLIQTYVTHSGFSFGGTWLDFFGLVDDAAWHDYHHSANCGNYGKPFMDWLGGTMDSWLLEQERLKAKLEPSVTNKTD